LSFTPAMMALHYGQAIFEGMKAYRGASGDVLTFRPLDNWKRINTSAERLCMPTLPQEVFMGGLTELLRLDSGWVPDRPGYSLYIRPVMYATDEYIGVSPSNTYQFVIFTCPVGVYYAKPLKVWVETHYSRAAEGGVGFSKNAGNYAGSLYPTKLAHQKGYDQLIWTDAKEHQYVEEAGTMNFMFLIDNVLVTPSTVDDTILKGITRDSVLQLARDWGMPTEERKVSVREVLDGIQKGTLQEAFGAGTAATIAPISLIHHAGTDYVLPNVETRAFSNRVLQALNDIKHGRSEDPHGWVYKAE
ncbi:MAG: branched-chain amino acid aminotransferase, partial [Ferruginibacter sp.]|nr:branched-chain amino acid aminotransferase [Cytophagales bacterium]